MHKSDDQVFGCQLYPNEIFTVVNSVNHFWILGNKAKKVIDILIISEPLKTSRIFLFTKSIKNLFQKHKMNTH